MSPDDSPEELARRFEHERRALETQREFKSDLEGFKVGFREGKKTE